VKSLISSRNRSEFAQALGIDGVQVCGVGVVSVLISFEGTTMTISIIQIATKFAGRFRGIASHMTERPKWASPTA